MSTVKRRSQSLLLNSHRSNSKKENIEIRMAVLGNNSIDEARIRLAVHSNLLSHHHNQSHGTRVIDELGLDHGQARIDIAVVSNRLHGIEIKSQQDNLDRLPSQAKVYNLYFDRVTLVFAEKFYNEVVALVPEWWRLISVIQGQRGGLYLKRIRPGKPNTNVDSESIVKLLWRNEVVELLKNNGVVGSELRQPKINLYGKLLEQSNDNRVHKIVCNALRNRENWHNR